MKKHTVETIIKGLRIRSKSNPQERLENILNAHDQWQQRHFSTLRSRRLRVKWTAGLVCLCPARRRALPLSMVANEPGLPHVGANRGWSHGHIHYQVS